MLHSAGKHMLLTVRYFSHSQQLQPLSFLNVRKPSGNNLRKESVQDHKGADEEKETLKELAKKLDNRMEVLANLMGN